MKILLFPLLMIISLTGSAQSLSINTDGSAANLNAMLDVKSTTKGLLIPRLTSVQRNAISTPASGLEVYDSDLNQFYFYNGTAWTAITYGANANNFWTLSGGNIYNNTGTNVGIGAVTPLAKLTVEGTDDAGPQDLFKLSKVNYGSTIFYQYYTDAGNWGTKMRGSSGPAPAFTFNMQNGRLGLGTAAPGHQLELSTDDAAKPSSSTWTVSSDIRLKTVDGQYNKGLKDLLQLNTIMYHYSPGNAMHLPTDAQGYGFSAQEVQKIFPEAVKTSKDGYLSIDMHPILVSYINAFKEQQAHIEKLEAMLKELIKKMN